MTKDRNLTVAEVVRLIERLNKRWPKYLELFSLSGSLILIDHRRDPSEEELEHFESLDYGNIVCSYSCVPVTTTRILNDGGAPYTLENGDYLGEQEPIGTELPKAT